MGSKLGLSILCVLLLLVGVLVGFQVKEMLDEQKAGRYEVVSLDSSSDYSQWLVLDSATGLVNIRGWITPNRARVREFQRSQDTANLEAEANEPNETGEAR